jgi:multicomponent Na+:H+ antiporter subunit D
MNSVLIILPIIIPLATGILLLFFKDNFRAHKYVNGASSLVLLWVAFSLFAEVHDEGIRVLYVGSWSAPFGITLVADLFSSIMVVIASVIAFATALYSVVTVDEARQRYLYFPLLQFLMMGINGSFLTGDIFNLYVWFEVMLISSFVLIALGGQQEQLEGAIKYVTINLISSAIFLAAVGITYGITGTLNMADLAVKMSAQENSGIVTLVSMLFLIAFGIKSAIFPLFFWLPASYHTPPSAVSAIFAGLLTKVGVYALIRVFTLIFTHNVDLTHTILLVIAGLTMVTGVLGAAVQNDFRRILSFHIISQIGYMVMGLALYSPLALAGGIFYIIHHIIVKTNLFFVSGAVKVINGTYDLRKLGGIYRRYPILSILFLIPALSLAGIPPLSGFWAKFIVIKAGIDLEQYLIVGVALFVGLLTLFSMTKIWNEVFWKDEPSMPDNADRDAYTPLTLTRKATLFAPIVLLAAITVIIGLWSEPFFRIAQETAAQLLDPADYIHSVLGMRP